MSTADISFSLRSCENMLRKTGDLEARTARCAVMLPSEALITMSVWMLSDSIRPRDVRAVSVNSLCVDDPSPQIEQGSVPCGIQNHHNKEMLRTKAQSNYESKKLKHTKLVNLVRH